MLDDFGQTVNIAARVQGLAYAGEIWITQPVYETPGVPDFLADHGYAIEQQTAMLKGVREKATVYKCVAR
jgi:class 3 adenylate cyclase